MTMTPAQRERKIDEARILIRRARSLLDAVHTDYNAALSIDLTPADRVTWREVVDLLTPLDKAFEAGLLDR